VLGSSCASTSAGDGACCSRSPGARSSGTWCAPSTSPFQRQSVCTSIPSCSATSLSSGARPSARISASRAAAISRVLRRIERGTWSCRRSSSRIAPRMRGAAKVLKASPRDASKASSAAMSPIEPALTSSSKSAFTASVRDICRATWCTRPRCSVSRRSRAA
jgi:hypothetical protein